jgi:hypothetical protein
MEMSPGGTSLLGIVSLLLFVRALKTASSKREGAKSQAIHPRRARGLFRKLVANQSVQSVSEAWPQTMINWF